MRLETDAETLKREGKKRILDAKDDERLWSSDREEIEKEFRDGMEKVHNALKRLREGR